MTPTSSSSALSVNSPRPRCVRNGQYRGNWALLKRTAVAAYSGEAEQHSGLRPNRPMSWRRRLFFPALGRGGCVFISYLLERFWRRPSDPGWFHQKSVRPRPECCSLCPGIHTGKLIKTTEAFSCVLSKTICFPSGVISNVRVMDRSEKD